MRKYTAVFLPLFLASFLNAADFVDGQAARAVLGQVVFTTGASTPGFNVLGGASGLAFDPLGRRLFVVDSNRVGAVPQDHRVLVFDTTEIPAPQLDVSADAALVNQPSCYLCGFAAHNTLGQTSFSPPDTSVSPPVFDAGLSNNPAAPMFNNPTAAATDGHIFALADTDNNRVLIWTSIPTTVNQPANIVLGQLDFTTRQSPGLLNASSFRGPQGVWIQGTKLFVADTQNHRILIWNTIPTTNNQAADLVLGQPDFVHANAPPPTKTNPVTAANQLLNPVAVTSDGTHLFVADLGFNRVLIWNSIPTAVDQNADVVVGQPDMVSSAPNNAAFCGTNASGTTNGPCAASLDFPRFALADNQNRLFIADGGNGRVLVFDSIPTANGASASHVLGQPNFTTDVNTSQSISIASTTIDNTGAVDTLPTPTSLAWDGTNLYVADPYNRRVLIFSQGDSLLPSIANTGFATVVNWASEIIRQEGVVVFTLAGTITAGDTATITIAGTDYTYTIKSGDTLDTIAQAVIKLINASDPNVTAFFAGTGSGTVYLSTKGTNLAYDSLTLAATTSNPANVAATASGSYLFAGTAATGAPGMLVEVNAPPGVTFTDSTAPLVAPQLTAANPTGPLPTKLGGAQLYMDGLASPLWKVSQSQLVGQIPYSFGDRNSTSVYVRTERTNGATTVTNAVPVYIAPANPGIFNAPSFPGQQPPFPASMAFHQSGNPNAVVSIDGSVHAGDTAAITINGRSYSYTVVAADTLETIASGLAAVINNANDPDATASVGAAFDRVVITARQPGAAGVGITIAGAASTTTGTAVTVTAYSSATCCDVVPGSPIYVGNPAAPGELITVNATGLGQLTDPTGTAQTSLVTGQPYTGPVPNTAAQFVTATLGGQTAQVVSAGLAPGSYGLYQVQMIVPTSLTANNATQLYIAQNAFISNTATIPVGAATASPPQQTPIPVNSPITMNIDVPLDQSTQSGTILVGGWAVDNNVRVASVVVSVDGAIYGTASYGSPRTDVCTVYPNRPSCPNVGWDLLLDTTRFANGAHTIYVKVTDNNGLHYTGARAFTISNDMSASPTHIYLDSPSANNFYHGLVTFQGWAVNDTAAVSVVSVALDGVPLGNATYGVYRPDVCQLYAGRSGCPNVGWSYLIDLSTIPNGAHTFAVTATAANGQYAVSVNTFNVSNWSAANPVRISIDVPGASSAAFSGTAAFAGWAIDDDAAIASVSVSIDGVPYGNAGYGGARSDVCAVYPNHLGCPNVGWGVVIDTTHLSDGIHTLSITANPFGGQSYTTTAQFSVANLATAANPVRISIDVPNANSSALTGVSHIGGWALSDNSAVTNLQVLVDGVAYGVASYGGNRADVCAVYPGRPGCPYTGWDYQLDTRLLTNGSHMLELTATTAAGQRATASSAFTVSNATGGVARVLIDTPNLNSNPFIGLAQFHGWAINDNALVTGVSVSIDGVPYGGAIYGIARPDVCIAYPGRQGCPNVGWSFSVDTTQLSDGAHTLGVTEIAADGSYSTASAAFTVANFSAANPMQIDIDYPSGQLTPPYFGTVHLGGWAIDTFGAIASITIAIDGLPFGNAAYGGPRPDVCSIFSGRQGCPNVGWNFNLDTTLVANGTHTLAVTATTTNGQSSTTTTGFSVSN